MGQGKVTTQLHATEKSVGGNQMSGYWSHFRANLSVQQINLSERASLRK